MIKPWLITVCSGLAAGIAGCSSSDENDPAPGTGGATASGGVAPITGGTTASGGSTASGGTTASGGAPASGGGTGGAGTSGSMGLGGDAPEDLSQAGIETFLKSDVFASWTWDSDVPRAAGAVSPHGRVRVGINSILEDAIAAGLDGSSSAKAFPPGSMALKEMYDSADTMVGRAFILKRGQPNTTPNWLYYCDGPPASCGLSSGTTPFYATGNTSSFCNTCHGSFFFIGAD